MDNHGCWLRILIPRYAVEVQERARRNRHVLLFEESHTGIYGFTDRTTAREEESF
jgi:hypothetical protein